MSKGRKALFGLRGYVYAQTKGRHVTFSQIGWNSKDSVFFAKKQTENQSMTARMNDKTFQNVLNLHNTQHSVTTRHFWLNVWKRKTTTTTFLDPSSSRSKIGVMSFCSVHTWVWTVHQVLQAAASKDQGHQAWCLRISSWRTLNFVHHFAWPDEAAYDTQATLKTSSEMSWAQVLHSRRVDSLLNMWRAEYCWLRSIWQTSQAIFAESCQHHTVQKVQWSWAQPGNNDKIPGIPCANWLNFLTYFWQMTEDEHENNDSNNPGGSIAYVALRCGWEKFVECKWKYDNWHHDHDQWRENQAVAFDISLVSSKTRLFNVKNCLYSCNIGTILKRSHIHNLNH